VSTQTIQQFITEVVEGGGVPIDPDIPGPDCDTIICRVITATELLESQDQFRTVHGFVQDEMNFNNFMQIEDNVISSINNSIIMNPGSNERVFIDPNLEVEGLFTWLKTARVDINDPIVHISYIDPAIVAPPESVDDIGIRFNIVVDDTGNDANFSSKDGFFGLITDTANSTPNNIHEKWVLWRRAIPSVVVDDFVDPQTFTKDTTFFNRLEIDQVETNSIIPIIAPNGPAGPLTGGITIDTTNSAALPGAELNFIFDYTLFDGTQLDIEADLFRVINSNNAIRTIELSDTELLLSHTNDINVTTSTTIDMDAAILDVDTTGAIDFLSQTTTTFATFDGQITIDANTAGITPRDVVICASETPDGVVRLKPEVEITGDLCLTGTLFVDLIESKTGDLTLQSNDGEIIIDADNNSTAVHNVTICASGGGFPGVVEIKPELLVTGDTEITGDLEVTTTLCATGGIETNLINDKTANLVIDARTNGLILESDATIVMQTFVAGSIIIDSITTLDIDAATSMTIDATTSMTIDAATIDITGGTSTDIISLGPINLRTFPGIGTDVVHVDSGIAFASATPPANVRMMWFDSATSIFSFTRNAVTNFPIVLGPSTLTSTLNAIARFNTVNGHEIVDSLVTIDALGNIAGTLSISADNYLYDFTGVSLQTDNAAIIASTTEIYLYTGAGGAITISAAVVVGRQIIVKNNGTGAITVGTFGAAEDIDFVATTSVAVAIGASVTLIGVSAVSVHWISI